MNPYFAFSAVLACGLYGITHSLPLTQPPLSTSASSTLSPKEAMAQFERLPRTLESATAKMAAPGSMARKVLGDGFVDHFAATRENEVELFNAAVTDWETKRYLELA